MVGLKPFSLWVARPEDVIMGKLMAWQEGRSERHTADIFEMLLFYYLGGHEGDLVLDEDYVHQRAQGLGEEVVSVWELLNESAQDEATRHEQPD